jgi:hypothetical protein
MINILAKAVKSSAWQGSDGIITEGSSPSSNNDSVGFKGAFAYTAVLFHLLIVDQLSSFEVYMKLSTGIHRITISGSLSIAILTSR